MDTPFGAARRGIDSGSYSDLNRLNQLKVGKDRDGEENVRKVAQEFESLFLNEMLKSMRSATEVLAKDNPFNSQAAKQYQDMHDQQLSVTLSKQGGGIGLADVLVRQLGKQTERATPSNPFNQVTQPQSPSTIGSLATAEVPRDDSRLLNLRRLALPGRMAERSIASESTIQPFTAEPGQVTPLVDLDWKPATAFAAPKDKPLIVNGMAAMAQNAPSKTRFSSAEEFMATMLPMAESAAKRLGVEPSYLVAQAALETGWGKSMIRQKDGSNSHNLFGIKANGWEGESARVRTTEYVNGKPIKQMAGFRAYDSFEQSFNDYVDLLQNSGRYQTAIKVADSSGNSEHFMRELQKAGYATDPQYASKVNQIARKVRTYQTIADASSASAVRTRG